jgi:hypothetical protein
VAYHLPASPRDVATRQHGVIAREQALLRGIDTIGRRLRGGEWQRLQRGVYATFTGEPPRDSLLWAAVLRAGTGAVLSHHSAAELFHLTDHPASLIHVTVPAERHLSCIPGIIIYRSARLPLVAHPSLLPPRTRVDYTVLDLVNQAPDFGRAWDWACAACQRRLTTADRLRAAMDGYARLRWRSTLADALTEIASGVHSRLERGYVHSVERRHHLPAAGRQARQVHGGASSYLDNLYDEFLVRVELDGHAAHPDHHRWRDIGRDNAGAAEGQITLRYGWADVIHRPCLTAAQVAAVLRTRGWSGSPRPCARGCPVKP